MRGVFWAPLRRAFEESDGFTVRLMLTTGATLEVSMAPLEEDDPEALTGEIIEEDRPPFAVRTEHVAGYIVLES